MVLNWDGDRLGAAAGGTASRAVLFSGITVVPALTGFVILPLTIFQTIGFDAILVLDSRTRNRDRCWTILSSPPGAMSLRILKYL